MQVKLTKTAPEVDGYYFVKFDDCTGVHLVQVKVVGHHKQILADNCLQGAKPLYFNDFPDAWWSEQVQIVI